MRLSPDLDTGNRQRQQFTLLGLQNMDIRREVPGKPHVDGLRHIRVMVAGKNHDGYPGLAERLTGRRHKSLTHTRRVKEIAGDQDQVDGLVADHAGHDAHHPESVVLECVIGGKSPANVDIRSMEEPHTVVMLVRPASGSTAVVSHGISLAHRQNNAHDRIAQGATG